MSTPRHRVARVITRLNIGGPAIQAIELSTELRASGFDTCLIYGQLPAGEGDMTTILPLSTESVYLEELVRPISPLRDLRAFWRIYRTLCRWKPDIVHTHMAKAGTLGRLAALFYNFTSGRNHNARLIHTYHGHVFEGYFGSTSTKTFLAIERWLGRRTDVLVAISNRIKQDLLHTFRVAREDQIAIIPLGFDLERFLKLTDDNRESARRMLGVVGDAIVVSTVGRLTEIKQHALFLDMAGRLAHRSSRFVFLIVGDGELRNNLEQRAEQIGIAPRVRFLGWRGDLENVYSATDIFVLTSRNEGTPVALIEAMASSVAVISTDVGGVRDVIAHQTLGVVVPFGDAARLATAVERLANSPVQRAEMGRQAREFVRERFSRPRLLADICDLYWRLLPFRTTMP